MNLLLAQLPAPDSAASVGWLFLTFGGVAAGLYYIVELWRSLSGKKDKTEVGPQPFVVAEHQAPVTRADLEKVDTSVHGRVKRERAEIDAQIARVEQAAKERADNLDRKIDANTTLTASISGEVKQINQNVQLVLQAIARK